eukprot:7827081-Lingulodinium_polyedra.AAC.1
MARAGSMLWHYAALPGKLALLTCSSEDQVQVGLQHCKWFWEVWVAARARGEGQVRDFCRRSFMNWVFVQESCQTLVAQGFSSVPLDLLADLTE